MKRSIEIACTLYCRPLTFVCGCCSHVHDVTPLRQEEGPSEEDVTTVLTLDQRAWETEQQENSFWHTNLVSSYKSRTYNLVTPSLPYCAVLVSANQRSEYLIHSEYSNHLPFLGEGPYALPNAYSGCMHGVSREHASGCQCNKQTLMSHVAAQTKDLDMAYTRRIEARESVRAEADAASVQAALCRVFPMPCRSRYVALSLLPQKPLLERMV